TAKRQCSNSLWRNTALALGRGVAAAALLLAGSQAALATFAAAPTVQCTGQCQGCYEMESTPDGAGRCPKGGVLPAGLGNDSEMYDAFTSMLNAANSYRGLHGSPPLTWSSDLAKQAQAWADTCPFNDPNNAAAGFKHSIERGAFSQYGENLFWTGKSDESGAV